MIYILMGVSGCGKTTVGKIFAEALGLPFYDGDDFHSGPNIAKMRRGIPLDDNDRLEWLQLLAGKIIEWDRPAGAVLACSALKKSYRSILSSGGRVPVTFILLDGSYELVSKYLKRRKGHFFPVKLLKSQFEILERPEDGITVNIDQTPRAVCGEILEGLKRTKEGKEVKKSDIGIYGLGVMGQNLALNFSGHGYAVSVYNRPLREEKKAVSEFIADRCPGKDIICFNGIGEFTASLSKPRKILIMIKAGKAVDKVIKELLPFLSEDDIIIDGGNSHYADTERRLLKLGSSGIGYIGCGISGGSEGALNGPSIMPGGSRKAWLMIESMFKSVAARYDGSPCCEWIGEGGAGHFVKMVHNGIEYSIMQLIAEVFDIMTRMLKMKLPDIYKVFSSWNSGVLQSYLLKITCELLKAVDDKGIPVLDNILDYSTQKGTGQDILISALELGIPFTLTGEAVQSRYLSGMIEERKKTALLFDSSRPFTGNRGAFLAGLQDAYYCTQLTAYEQGFRLIEAASQKYNWKIQLENVMKIWRGGCIIQSRMLNKIASQDVKNNELKIFEKFARHLKEKNTGWREAVAGAVRHGIPVPVMSSSISYFDGLRSAILPANLTQAQRDYFGSHGFARIDAPADKVFHLKLRKL